MLAEKGVATEKNVNIALQRNTRWVSGFQRCGSVPVFKRHCCWEWIVHPAERTNQLGELDLQKSPEYHQTSGNYVDDKTLGSCLKLVLCTSSFAIAILLRHICPWSFDCLVGGLSPSLVLKPCRTIAEKVSRNSGARLKVHHHETWKTIGTWARIKHQRLVALNSNSNT